MDRATEALASRWAQSSVRHFSLSYVVVVVVVVVVVLVMVAVAVVVVVVVVVRANRTRFRGRGACRIEDLAHCPRSCRLAAEPSR